MINTLNEQLNLNISYLPIVNNSFGLEIGSEYLKESLLNNMENKIGTNVLKMSLPIEAYSRYKNGTISSMIKGKNGKILKHSGHQEIKVADILDDIFYQVSYHYTEKILLEFRDFFNNLQLTIQETQTNIINIIDYNFNREYVNNLYSITEFFQEIYDDMGEISASKSRCDAYLVNIIKNRQELLKLINHFLDNLNTWTYNGKWNFDYPDYNSLNSDYLICRQAISNYAMCLIFEHILSGSLTDSSKKKMINKIENKYEQFNNIDNHIQSILNHRQNNNNYWYNNNYYNRNDYHNIQSFMEQYQNNNNFEIDEIEKLFDKSKKLLNNIIIEEDKSKL